MKMANGSWYMVSTRASPTREFCRPEPAEQHVERHQQGRVRHHQDRQCQQEQRVPAGEPEAAEGVAAEDRQRQGERDRQHRDDGAVPQVRAAARRRSRAGVR